MNEFLGPFENADLALEELRRVVAEIIGADPDTWPEHKNATLAIAAAVGLRESHVKRLTEECDALRAELEAAHEARRNAPSVEAAEKTGAKGGPIVQAERLAFEAWMRGHCWALSAEWDGKQYLGKGEANGKVSVLAMRTRELWAAWRDRAALAAAPEAKP